MMTNASIPFLSGQQLTDLGITTSQVISSMEKLIMQMAKQTAWSAPKAALTTNDGRYMMATLAASDDPPLLAVKAVVLNPDNPQNGIPQINGLVVMLDSNSGLPVAILDANWITATRTAGLSATAAQRMARGDASVVAFVGCGVQARSHLQAFADLFPLRQVRMFGRGQANIDRLCRDAESRSLPAVVCSSAEDAIVSADLVVSSVTYSPHLTTFLDANWLKSGSFAAITDLAAPWKKESFSVLNQIAIDDLDQEAVMPDKLVPPEFVTGDLSGLVLGRFPGRDHDSDRNAFVFRGHAMGDLALSALAYQKALGDTTGMTDE